MKLQLSDALSEDWKEYKCDLTQKLDELAGLDSNDFFSHYLLITQCEVEDKCIPIRVPGGTVGSLDFDDDKRITAIEINRNYVIKTYPDNLNEEMKKFIGNILEDIGDEQK